MPCSAGRSACSMRSTPAAPSSARCSPGCGSFLSSASSWAFRIGALANLIVSVGAFALSAFYERTAGSRSRRESPEQPAADAIPASPAKSTDRSHAGPADVRGLGFRIVRARNRLVPPAGRAPEADDVRVYRDAGDRACGNRVRQCAGDAAHESPPAQSSRAAGGPRSARRADINSVDGRRRAGRRCLRVGGSAFCGRTPRVLRPNGGDEHRGDFPCGLDDGHGVSDRHRPVGWRRDRRARGRARRVHLRGQRRGCGCGRTPDGFRPSAATGEPGDTDRHFRALVIHRAASAVAAETARSRDRRRRRGADRVRSHRDRPRPIR